MRERDRLRGTERETERERERARVILGEGDGYAPLPHPTQQQLQTNSVLRTLQVENTWQSIDSEGVYLQICFTCRVLSQLFDLQCIQQIPMCFLTGSVQICQRNAGMGGAPRRDGALPVLVDIRHPAVNNTAPTQPAAPRRTSGRRDPRKVFGGVP